MGQRQLGVLSGKANELALAATAVDLRLRQLGHVHSGSGCRGRRPGGAQPHGAQVVVQGAKGGRLQLGQGVQGLLLGHAGQGSDLDSVLLGQQGVLDGSQHAQGIGKGGGASFGPGKVVLCQAPVDSVTQQGPRGIHHLAHFLGAALGNEVGRVQVVGQGHGPKLYGRAGPFRGHAGVDELQGAIGCALTCGIAVEQVHDGVLGMPAEQADVLTGQGGSQGCHHVGQSRLMAGDHVRIAFHHHGNAGGGHGRLGLVKPVEHLGLVEDGSFLGVQVLGLPPANDAPAESNGLA